MITSPQPYDSPSRIENRISSSSSPGLFGWMREPKWRGAPTTTPSPSSGLNSARATHDSSSFVITFATAAIASLASASECFLAHTAASGPSSMAFTRAIVSASRSLSKRRSRDRLSAAVTPSSTKTARRMSPIVVASNTRRASSRRRSSVVPSTARSPSLNALASVKTRRSSWSAISVRACRSAVFETSIHHGCLCSRRPNDCGARPSRRHRCQGGTHA